MMFHLTNVELKNEIANLLRIDSGFVSDLDHV